MARGLNKVMLIGNLGADPEIKYTAGGTPIANLRLATAESRKNKEGQWEDTTEWHRIVMFGRSAEVCKDYLKKGSKIYIEGRIQTQSWDDKQSGQKRFMTEIVGNQMVMLDAKGSNDYSGQQSQQSQPRGGQPQQQQQQSSGGYDAPPDNLPQMDDDLPF